MNSSERVSASQVSRARACMRRWAWERVAPGPPKAEHAARLELGKAVHAVAEAYHRDGQAPDRTTQAGRVFLPALPHLPPPGRGQTELEIRLDEPATLGYVDLIAPAQDMPGGWVGPEHVILDYKTKNSFQARGMFQGIGDLLTDPQALTYMRWYFATYTGARLVGLRWLYLRVQGRPAARTCDAVVDRSQAMEAYERLVLPISRTLIQLRKKPLDPLTLEPNPLECTRYGARYACPYISRCGLTPVQKLAGVMNMGLVDELRAQFGDKRINPPEGQDKPAQSASNRLEAPAMLGLDKDGTGPDFPPRGIEQGRLVRALRDACAAFVAAVDSSK